MMEFVLLLFPPPSLLLIGKKWSLRYVDSLGRYISYGQVDG